MKTTAFRNLPKYLLRFSVVVILFSLTGCNLPFKVVFNDQPEEHFEMEAPENGGEAHFDEEQPLEEYPEGGFIEFEAERTNLAPGECTMIWWHAEGAEDVKLNGDRVEPMGEQEVCLEENKRFVLEAGGDRREIEFVLDGMPGEEHPPEEEQPHGEEPPPSGHMSDEEGIKQALLAELGWSESELHFDIGRIDNQFAEGGVSKGGELGGATWLAAKEGSGKWVIVHHGQDHPQCEGVNALNIPTDWVPYCWDAASGTSVKR